MDATNRESGFPSFPHPGFGRASFPAAENNLTHQRPTPSGLPPLTGPGPIRLPRAEFAPPQIPSTGSLPRSLPSSGARASNQSADTGKVKQTGEMLQNMMLRHQMPPGTKPSLSPAMVPAAAPALTPTSTPLPLRQQPRQKSAGEVTPLRRPLPPEGPLPLKPKRPPNVNLEPYVRINRGPALPATRKSGSPALEGKKMPSPAPVTPPILPQRFNKPGRLPRQIASVDIDDNQDTYDDIGSFERNESCSDSGSQYMDRDDENDVYEYIDEDQEVNQVNVEIINKKDDKKHRDQEKKEKVEREKKEKELWKNFQLQAEVEVLNIAKVRHDWHGGGRLDLAVRQGESVEILRVKNNLAGMWLARSLNGKYGYISNTCVDIDYEAVKRKVLQSRKTDTSVLPPPPPDPPQMLPVDLNSRDSMIQEDDDYDDVQPIPEDFPPPPPEICLDSKMAKELRKKFKYEGPIKVLHTMMVDPNATIKKPGGKDLHVSQGEVLDIIQITNSKKALCLNRFGKYGYVPRTLLLPMEGDIYDDVDYPGDVYDNDSPHTDY